MKITYRTLEVRLAALTEAVGWQVAILEPFKRRGCWKNLDLAVLAKTVSIKQPKTTGGKSDGYSCILCIYKETLAMLI